MGTARDAVAQLLNAMCPTTATVEVIVDAQAVAPLLSCPWRGHSQL